MDIAISFDLVQSDMWTTMWYEQIVIICCLCTVITVELIVPRPSITVLSSEVRPLVSF